MTMFPYHKNNEFNSIYILEKKKSRWKISISSEQWDYINEWSIEVLVLKDCDITFPFIQLLLSSQGTLSNHWILSWYLIS